MTGVHRADAAAEGVTADEIFSTLVTAICTGAFKLEITVPTVIGLIKDEFARTLEQFGKAQHRDN